MNDMELSKIKEFAMRKKEILDSIYDITRKCRFVGEQSEIDGFIEYLNIREPYYKELSELKNESKGVLESFKIEFDNKNELYRDVSQILSNTAGLAMKIAELDNENNKNMQGLTDKLKAEVKKINISKKARNSYNFFQVQSHAGNSFNE